MEYNKYHLFFMENEKVRSTGFVEFFSSSKVLHYKKGEIIIRPEQTPSGIYYIEDGYVKIYSITEDGDEKLHVIYKAGEIFPLVWALKNIQRESFYEAISNVTVRKVAKGDFLNFINTSQQAMAELTELLISTFNVFIDRVDNLEISKAYPRLVDQLLFLAERFGVKRDGAVVIEAPITHKDIGNSIAMSRETASREMENLEKKGLVHYTDHLITITDLDKLTTELSKHTERELL